MMRIALSGPSGSGRSTVAEVVSKTKNIPFLMAKDITTPILKRDGYDYASGVKVEKFLQTPNRQIEILSKTQIQQNGNNFITDRGFVDIAAYALMAMDSLDKDVLEEILTETKNLSKTYDHIFLFKLGHLIDNKKRTMCRHYQEMVYTLQLGLLNAWDLKYTIIENDNLDPSPKAEKIIKTVWG